MQHGSYFLLWMTRYLKVEIGNLLRRHSFERTKGKKFTFLCCSDRQYCPYSKVIKSSQKIFRFKFISFIQFVPVTVPQSHAVYFLLCNNKSLVGSFLYLRIAQRPVSCSSCSPEMCMLKINKNCLKKYIVKHISATFFFFWEGEGSRNMVSEPVPPGVGVFCFHFGPTPTL